MSSTRRRRRKAATESVDNYPTPEWSVRRLFEGMDDLHGLGKRWLEPCAGDGVIIEVANEFRSDLEWTAVEVRDTRRELARTGAERIIIGDFFYFAGKHSGSDKPFDVSIFNPPFPLTMEFVEACLMMSRHVICMQRMNFCGSEKRNDFFLSNMPDLDVVPNRISFTGNGKGDSVEHAWHRWDANIPKKVGQCRVLRDTPLSERKACYARTFQAKDGTSSALATLFGEALE